MSLLSKVLRFFKIDGVFHNPNRVDLQPPNPGDFQVFTPIHEMPSLPELAKCALDEEERRRQEPYLKNRATGKEAAKTKMSLPELEVRDALCYAVWLTYHILQFLGASREQAEYLVSSASWDEAPIPLVQSKSRKKDWVESPLTFVKMTKIGSAAVQRITGFADPDEAKRFHEKLLPPRAKQRAASEGVEAVAKSELNAIRLLGRAYRKVRKLGKANRKAFAAKTPRNFFEKLTAGLLYDEEINVTDVMQIAYASTADVCELFPNYEFARYIMEAATVVGRLHRLQPVHIDTHALWVLLSLAQLEPKRGGPALTHGEVMAAFLRDELEKMAPLEALIPRMQAALDAGRVMTINPSINMWNFQAAH